MLLSPCGVDCAPCTYKESCGGGCRVCEGKPFYIKDFGAEFCSLYHCAVNQKGYTSCAECPKLPCQIFFDWKDPSMSQEDHLQSIKDRVALLKESAI